MPNKPLTILLLNLPSSGSYSGFAGATYMPLGVAYIGSVLRKAGHNVELVNLHAEQALGKVNDSYLANLLSSHDYDLLGLGGVFFLSSALKKVVAYSKENRPGAPVVLGGSLATRAYRLFLQEIRQIDIVVIGEGERTILDIVDKIYDRKLWKDIAGIAYRDGDEVNATKQRGPIDNLDEIPFPARDLLPFDAQYKKAFFQDGPGRYCTQLIASRGCPYHCIFCEPIFGRRPRVRSIDNVLNEIDLLITKHNVKYFRFWDEMFMGGRKSKVQEFCRRVADNKLPIFWWCFTNGNLVDKETLLLMKKAGCINISFGLESASRVILEEMDKNCNLQQHYEMTKFCKRIGIRTQLAWLAGSFSETEATLQESKEYFLAANRYQYRATILNKIIPVPGTRLFEQAVATGKIKNLSDYIASFEEMNAQKEDVWNNIPNLTDMEASEFDVKIAEIKKEVMISHQRQYTAFRKIMIFLGLDHINWTVAFKNFRIRDVRPLFEAIVWAMLNRKNRALRVICEILIYGRTHRSATTAKSLIDRGVLYKGLGRTP